jgi:hypothetical protein
MGISKELDRRVKTAFDETPILGVQVLHHSAS